MGDISPAKMQLSALNTTLVNPLHPLKAQFPMDITLSGMEMVVKPKQFQKEYAPIEVTLLPIVTDDKPAKP